MPDSRKTKRAKVAIGSIFIDDRSLVQFEHVLYNPAMRWLLLCMVAAWLHECAVPAIAQSQGRTSSGPVGASMALLATLQDAGVLPPDHSPDANRVIQIVIQFQGLFMKSPDPAVREFVDLALASKYPEQAGEMNANFRRDGWTSQIVEAVCERYSSGSDQERARWAIPFSRVNMRPADLDLLSQLYNQARARFSERGQDIHRIFAEHRRTMPGGKRYEQKEKPDGDQGLYPYQSKGGADEGRVAVVEEACRCGTGSFLLRTA